MPEPTILSFSNLLIQNLRIEKDFPQLALVSQSLAMIFAPDKAFHNLASLYPGDKTLYFVGTHGRYCKHEKSPGL